MKLKLSRRTLNACLKHECFGRCLNTVNIRF